MNITDARQETNCQAAQDTAGGSWGSSPQDGTAPEFTPGQPPIATRPPLVRPLHGRMLAGVGAGIADYLGVDVTIVRIVLAVLTFVGGAGLPIYLAGWLLIPEEGAEHSIVSEFAGSPRSRSY